MPAANQVQRFAVVSMLVAVAMLLGFAFLGVFFPDSPILGLEREDGIIEWSAVVFWAASAVLCGYRLVTGRGPRLLLVFWMLLSVLAMGEEASWFQRLLGVETPPEIAEVNAQGELNLHNLRGLPFESQNVFRAGYIFYFLILPLLMAAPRIRGLARRLGYLAPHPWFLVMTWTVIALSVVLSQLGPAESEEIIVETQETFMAFVVLTYVYLYLRPAFAEVPAQTSIPPPGQAPR